MRSRTGADGEMVSGVSQIIHDDSIGLLAYGYDLGAHVWRRGRGGARSAPMRLLGRDALLVRGAEGVAVFYDEGRIARHGAMPAIVQETLFGQGSVHSLDGAEHHHRKATFAEVAYVDAQVDRMAPFLEQEWAVELDSWVGGGDRTAYDAAVGAFGRASMRWAGLPGTSEAMTRWAARLAQIVDGFGTPYSAILESGLHVNRRRLPTKPASGARVKAAAPTARCPFH
jgi:fatty-acid peroxygenase